MTNIVYIVGVIVIVVAVLSFFGLRWSVKEYPGRYAQSRSPTDGTRDGGVPHLYVSMAQLAQTAACTHFHVLAHANEFHLTHELLARMLGARKVGVTKAAGGCSSESWFATAAGTITVLARSGLEAAACGCYRSAQNLYDRILG
jgi:hypothetical protein